MTLPIGNRFSFTATADYSNVAYEVRPDDNDRGTASAQLQRLITGTSAISLNASTERVRFDETATNADFDRDVGFLRYSIFSTRNTFALDVGANQVKVEGFPDTRTGTYAQLDWTRVLPAGKSFSVAAGQRLSDQGDIFRFVQGINPDLRETEDVTGESTPFENNFASVSFVVERERYGYDLRVTWNDEDYIDDDTLDRTVTRIVLLGNRRLTRKIFIDGGINYSRRDFVGPDRQDDDYQITASIGYEWTAGFDTTLSFQRFERGSNQEVNEFSENRLFLRASYAPPWGR